MLALVSEHNLIVQPFDRGAIINQRGLRAINRVPSTYSHTHTRSDANDDDDDVDSADPLLDPITQFYNRFLMTG